MFVSEKKNQFMDLPVVLDYGNEEDFFRVISPNGQEIHLKKLKFQLNQPLPEKLSCRVKGYNEGSPIIGHNMPYYVSEFYADGFSKGKEFDFKVISKPHDDSGFYRLEDNNGLQFKLHETKTPFAIGQTVKCRFEYLDQNVYILRRSNTDSQLKMLTIRDIGRILGLKPWIVEKLDLYLREIPELTKSIEELDNGQSGWIFSAIRAIKQVLPKWFNKAVKEYTFDIVLRGLEGCKAIALYMLEGSDFLRNIKGEERTNLQKILTNQIELIDIYIQALKIINSKGQFNFISQLLIHLKDAGYIYHPTFQLSILMILFRHSPELVNSSLTQLFDALMEWYPETWKTEPFRKAFVDQLEIYIQDTRHDIDEFLIPERQEDTEKIEKVLTAIALQQALAIDSDDINIQGNMAFFYRCLSLLRPAKAETLLWKSYLSLMGVRLPIDFTWNDIKEPSMMMTRASVDPPQGVGLPNASRYFITEKIEIEINGEGISINQPEQDSMGLVPNRMFDWPGLQVKAKDAHSMKPAKMRNLEGHKEFWDQVETSLFQPKENIESYSPVKRVPYIDDTVRIEVDRIIFAPYDNNKVEAFHCVIVDDHFVEGEGLMLPDDLASYNLHGVTIGNFRNDDGTPMQFDATVKDIDENDTFYFSLLEPARLAVRDLTFTDDICNAVITKTNSRSYSAISEKGFGLYIHRDHNNPQTFHNGTVLKVRITGFENDAVQAICEEGPLDDVVINNARALQNILRHISIKDDSNIEKDLDLDEEDLIRVDEIREIIETMRYKAISKSQNIIQAYDYLSYARIMAKAIGDQKLADVLKAHKNILMLHKHYATNKIIYKEDIDEILKYSHDSEVIYRLASKLYIVAALGSSEENKNLWTHVHSDAIEIERELAQMVLSCNLLLEVNHDESAINAIKDQIAKLLNVSSEQRNLKYYGSESQYVEFKSSIVYPAGKGKNGISLADPDKQEYEILHIIAGFLNSTGGTLYIGVSDDHYERGLEEDLKFYKLDQSERNTLYRRNIRSLDNLTNHLQNLIDKSYNIGINAGDYAKVYIDEEASKGIIMVKISPCQHIVYFDNQIFVRHGSKTEPILKQDEIQQFKEDRKALFQMQANVQANIEEEEKNKICTDTGHPIEKREKHIDNAQVHVSSSEIDNQQIETLTTGVHTSSVRKNILHDYLDPEHFVPVAMYIRFIGDHEFLLTSDEWSIEDTDRLDLAIKDDEMDQFLVMVYADEYVVKVPMRELIEKRKNQPYQHCAERELVFVCPMKDTDGLYSLHCNSKGTVYERFTPVSKIEQGSISSLGERLMDGECESSPFYEYVPSARTNEFEAIKSDVRRKSALGVLAKGDNTTKITPAEIAKSFYKNI